MKPVLPTSCFTAERIVTKCEIGEKPDPRLRFVCISEPRGPDDAGEPDRCYSSPKAATQNEIRIGGTRRIRVSPIPILLPPPTWDGRTRVARSGRITVRYDEPCVGRLERTLTTLGGLDLPLAQQAPTLENPSAVRPAHIFADRERRGRGTNDTASHFPSSQGRP